MGFLERFRWAKMDVVYHKVFISYRHDGGRDLARSIHNSLMSRGIDSFLDFEGLKHHHRVAELLEELRNRPNVVVILTAGCLDRCIEDDDWFRREIAYAIELKYNIVPVLSEGYTFPSASSLPSDIVDLPGYIGVPFYNSHYKSSIDLIISKLKSERSTRRVLLYAILGILACIGVLTGLIWNVQKRVPKNPEPAAVQDSRHDTLTSPDMAARSAGPESTAVNPLPQQKPAPPAGTDTKPHPSSSMQDPLRILSKASSSDEFFQTITQYRSANILTYGRFREDLPADWIPYVAVIDTSGRVVALLRYDSSGFSDTQNHRRIPDLHSYAGCRQVWLALNPLHQK